MSAQLHDLITKKNVAAAKGLLQTLVPRAQCFCFYDASRGCVWNSDGTDDYEVGNFVADLSDDAVAGRGLKDGYLRRTLSSGRTVLLLPVGGDNDQAAGVLIAVFSRNAGKSSWFNPSLLYGILQPAVEIISENLRMHRQLSGARAYGECVDQELRLVYEIDEKVHGASRSHAALAQLVGKSGRFLEIAYSVLLLPAKRIRISATHSSWKDVRRNAVDRYLLQKLFPKLEGRRSPVVFDVPKVQGSDNPSDKGYQALLCPLTNQTGGLEGVVALLCRVSGKPFESSHMRFMSHIVRKVEYIIEQSFDAMTGLMNRAGFEAQLVESAKSLHGDDDAHQLIYFDLDNLQLVNGSFGRDAGDEVILRFAQMLEEDLPRNAVVSRLTGDDFSILLTHSNTEDALDLTESVRRKGDKLRYLQGDKSLQVTMSVGIAPFDKSSEDGTDVITFARMACDAAKDHGRDRIEIYDSGNQSIIRRYDDMHLVSQIQRALDSDGFELLAQAIVPLADGDSRERYEILLRMKDADGNHIPSSALFSAAERYQLMPQIDRWVLSKTLFGLAPYRDVLLRDSRSFAINLSGQSLGDDELLSFIRQELDDSGIPASSICFELTESAAVSNRHKAQSFINLLRSRGCRFSLDDFGAGLSSFAYLKNFNVDTLKIDGSFIRDITNNRISESMVAAITQVAKVMELETVAEYVECEDTRKLVGKLGVNFAQGHAIGRPIPLTQVLMKLADSVRTA